MAIAKARLDELRFQCKSAHSVGELDLCVSEVLLMIDEIEQERAHRIRSLRAKKAWKTRFGPRFGKLVEVKPKKGK